MRIRPSFYLVFSSLAVSCSGPPIPSLNFTVATPFISAETNSGGACPPDLTSLSTMASTIRVTVRQHSADPTIRGALVCDSVFAKTAPATLALPSGVHFDLFAEAFSDDGHRVATGALFDVDPRKAPTMRMFFPEIFHCNPAGTLNQPRAFHTATTLPNGQILIAGGLIPAINGGEGPAPTGDQLFVDSSVEVFDPATETFLQIKGAITRRAFHSAIALPDDKSGKFQVLLVGGLSAMSADTPAVQSPVALTPFRFGFGDMTMLSAAPAEIVTWDPVAKMATRSPASKLPPGVFQAALALAGGGAVIAGGETSVSGPMFDQRLTIALDPQNPLLTTMLGEPRVAASIAASDATGGLLIGGLTDAMSTAPTIEKLGFGGAGTVTAATIAGDFPSTQFATVTAIDATHYLVSGGFKVGTNIDSMSAADPPLDNAGMFLIENAAASTVNVQKVKFDPITYPSGSDMSCQLPKRYRPTGWNAATLLASGDRVLITGGTGHFLDPTNCDDCDMDKSVQCVLGQTSIYDVASNTVAAASPSISIARFGHTQSLLADGRVLILGGLTRRPMGMNVYNTFAPKEVEEWSPVRSKPVTPLTMSSGQVLDPDDPVYLDLLASKSLLSRNPVTGGGKVGTGSQFYSGSDASMVPALPCGGLM